MIERYVTNLDGDVFAIHGLSEETIAVLFAYYSRSEDDLRSNLRKMLEDGDLSPSEGVNLESSERVKKFHEKWVVGYGHASVAEHAIIHLGIENVSILLSKVIEDCRLASYTEKSTRYVKWTRDKVRKNLHKRDEEVIDNLFKTYDRVFEALFDYSRERNPTLNDRAHTAFACDMARPLLPCGCLTNIGLTINARELPILVDKLLSYGTKESEELAGKIVEESSKVVPTLLRHVGSTPYRKFLSSGVVLDEYLDHPLSEVNSTDDMNFGVKVWEKSLEHAYSSIASAITYELEEDYDYRTNFLKVQASNTNSLRELFKLYLCPEFRLLASSSSKGKIYSPPGRALECASINFEIVTDYGSWRDIQRHRMCTWIPQSLNRFHKNYYKPDIISKLGGGEYSSIYENSIEYSLFAGYSNYSVPLATYIRVLGCMNFREAFHFIELRSGKNGHPQYRKIAQQLYTDLLEIYPEIFIHCQCDMNDYEMTR